MKDVLYSFVQKAMVPNLFISKVNVKNYKEQGINNIK